MSRTLAIAGRELRSYFLTPAGYVITCLFLLATGVLFCFGDVFEQGVAASLRPIFLSATWLLVMLCPAITMRTISEETRLGTLEALITCPVSEGQVILGKFLGGLGFLVVLLLPTLAYVAALEIHGRPDYGELLCGYGGLVLAGSAYLASGILASTLTSSQVVAYLLAVFFWFTTNLATGVLPQHLPARLGRISFLLNPEQRLNDFAIGLVDSANIVFFVSFAAVFLIAAVAFLKARRWA